MLRKSVFAIVFLSIIILGSIALLSPLTAALGIQSSGNNDPLTAIWDAIFQLRTKNKDLQAQIDDLKAERTHITNASTAAEVENSSDIHQYVSDLRSEISATTPESGNTLVKISIENNGPDRAAGVRLTAFYLMSLFDINNITTLTDTSINHQCVVQSRGIIQCTFSSLEPGANFAVYVYTTPRQTGIMNTWTADLFSTTLDPNLSNNHATYSFETGSSGNSIDVSHDNSTAVVENRIIQQPQNKSGDIVLSNNNSNTGNGNESEQIQNPKTGENRTIQSTESNLDGFNTAGGNTTLDSQGIMNTNNTAESDNIRNNSSEVSNDYKTAGNPGNTMERNESGNPSN